MSFTTAFEDLHEDLILAGQSENRRNELAGKLTEAITDCLNGLSTSSLHRRKVSLYPCELIAVQHFLTQLGFHLHRVSIQRNHVEEPLTYAVFPNWN